MSITIVSCSPFFARSETARKEIQRRGWDLVRLVDPDDPASAIPETLLDRLQRAISSAHVLVAGLPPVTAELLDRASKLKGICKFGVGVDNIDLRAAAKRGLPVCNYPNMNAVAVAELAVCCMLALSRSLLPAHTAVTSGKWRRFIGQELSGKTLGILGLGNIGMAVAEKAHALGMKLCTTTIDPDMDFVERFSVRLLPIEELMAQSHVVTIHVSGGPQSHKLVNKETLVQARPGLFLLNFARGSVWDMEAVAAGLKSGILGGAVVDTYDREPPEISHPLFSCANVICLPHMGGDSRESHERLTNAIMDDINTICSGDRPRRAFVL